jgi:chromosome segregation ATPase
MFGGSVSTTGGTPDLGVLTLLSMISDPKAAKQRLEELMSATKTHNEASAKIMEAQVQLNKTQKDVDLASQKLSEDKKAFETERSSHLQDYESKRKWIEDTIREVDTRTADLQNRKLAIESKEVNLDRRETSIRQQEVSLKQQAQDLANYKNQLDSLNTSLVSKLDQLKNIVNS